MLIGRCCCCCRHHHHCPLVNYLSKECRIRIRTLASDLLGNHRDVLSTQPSCFEEQRDNRKERALKSVQAMEPILLYLNNTSSLVTTSIPHGMILLVKGDPEGLIELKQRERESLQTAQPTLPHLGTNRYPEDLLIWAGLDGTGSSVTSLQPHLGLLTDRPAHKPVVSNPEEPPGSA